MLLTAFICFMLLSHSPLKETLNLGIFILYGLEILTNIFILWIMLWLIFLVLEYLFLRINMVHECLNKKTYPRIYRWIAFISHLFSKLVFINLLILLYFVSINHLSYILRLGIGIAVLVF